MGDLEVQDVGVTGDILDAQGQPAGAVRGAATTLDLGTHPGDEAGRLSSQRRRGVAEGDNAVGAILCVVFGVDLHAVGLCRPRAGVQPCDRPGDVVVAPRRARVFERVHHLQQPHRPGVIRASVGVIGEGHPLGTLDLRAIVEVVMKERHLPQWLRCGGGSAVSKAGCAGHDRRQAQRQQQETGQQANAWRHGSTSSTSSTSSSKVMLAGSRSTA